MKKLPTVACLATCWAGALCTFADTTDDEKLSSIENTTNNAPVHLSPVTVEASRTGSDKMHLSGEVQVIDGESCRREGVQNIYTALARKVTSLNLLSMGAGNPALAQISPAGYGETGFGRLAVKLDGELLNFADMSAPMLSRVDIDGLNRIEVLSGSQNVLHGEGASGGLLNLISEPADYDFHCRLRASVGSWDTYAASTSVSGGDEEAGLRYWGRTAWQKSSGYRANSEYENWNESGGLRQDWANGSFWRVRVYHSDADYGLPGYLDGKNWKKRARRSDTPDDWYRRTAYGLNSTLKAVINDENALTLDAFVSRSTMKTLSVSRGGYLDYPIGAPPAWVEYVDRYHLDYDTYSFGFTPQYVNTANVWGFDQQFIVGADYRGERLHGNSSDDFRVRPDFWSSSSYRTTKFEYLRQTMAFFGQEKFYLLDNLFLEAGARYQRTWSENTSLTEPRRISNVLAADGAIGYNPSETSKIYVKISRFYRHPFLDENPYLNYRAQKLLKPETGYRADFGGEVELWREFTLAGNVFYSRTEDEILYDKFIFGNNINSPDDTVRRGFTVSADWEREGLAGATLAYTFVDAQFDGRYYDGKKIPLVASSTILANLRYWLWSECQVFGGWRYLSSRRAASDFANAGARLAGGGVFHVGVEYAPKTEWLKGLKLSLTIDNLFDRRYADYAVRGASGNEVFYPAAGRSMTCSVGWEF